MHPGQDWQAYGLTMAWALLGYCPLLLDSVKEHVQEVGEAQGSAEAATARNKLVLSILVCAATRTRSHRPQSRQALEERERDSGGGDGWNPPVMEDRVRSIPGCEVLGRPGRHVGGTPAGLSKGVMWMRCFLAPCDTYCDFLLILHALRSPGRTSEGAAMPGGPREFFRGEEVFPLPPPLLNTPLCTFSA